MEEKLVKHVDLLIERSPALDVCKQNIILAYQILEEAYSAGASCLLPAMVVVPRTVNTL